MWVGLLNVREDNVYTFGSSNLDDGARLYIDDMNGTPYCKDWIVLAPHKFVCEPIHLTAGLHGFRVDYAQGPVNDSSLNLQWSSPSFINPETITASLSVPGTVTKIGNAGIAGAVINYTGSLAMAGTRKIAMVKGIMADTGGSVIAGADGCIPLFCLSADLVLYRPLCLGIFSCLPAEATPI